MVGQCLHLLQAMVDVVSSSGWLKPALAAMELSQMVVQARWTWDSPLLQIPHFTKQIVGRCDAHNKKVRAEKEKEDKMEEDDDDEDSGLVETVFDILDIDDDVRNELLQLSAGKMSDVARFCNAYPNIDMAHELKNPDAIHTGGVVEVLVQLERDVDEDEDEEALASLGEVVAPSYPKQKTEGWWLVVGNPQDNTLLSIKRISTLRRKARAKLEFAAPEEAGRYNLKLLLMCDSYLRCDQEYDLEIKVEEGEDSDSESDDEDDDEG